MSANIVVPEMGESIVDARVAKWLKREGDAVSAGEALVELETDKIDVEVSAPQAGVLQQISRGPGEDVKIGDVLGTIGESSRGEGRDAERTDESSRRGSGDAEGADESQPDAGTSAASSSAPARAEGSPARDDERTRATASARRLAEQEKVDLGEIRGTGDAGRVTRKDVEEHLAAQAAGPAQTEPVAKEPPPAKEKPAAKPAQSPPLQGPWPEADRGAQVQRRGPDARREERVRMSKRRATIARRLVEAQQTGALLTTFNEADMTAVMALRERRKQAFKERHGVNLGIASFFVKAAVGALRGFPRLNAEIQGDEMVLKHYYDIGVAVGAPEGLVVPVLHDADQMSFAEIELKIREFARKANDGTLTLEDLKGGTFTITNGGVFGSLVSTPIINPPQVGILGLHKIQDRPVAIEGRVEIRPMMFTALTYDHRIVDGAEAVRFLVRVKELVEDPGTLLLES
jgi:2-oxoglutarate dehydrogenase E2 component (dihydrolipoamide succinyltransferase)